jgi:hypothetical protein
MTHNLALHLAGKADPWFYQLHHEAFPTHLQKHPYYFSEAYRQLVGFGLSYFQTNSR